MYLAKKEYEPSLLPPMGFGEMFVNLPFSGTIIRKIEVTFHTAGII